MKHHISYFYNALLQYILPTASSVVWNIKFIKYRENKLTVTSYVHNVHHWHEHKHASVLAIVQLRCQSATAPTLATHAADAVAAHQCRERDTDVILMSHVKYLQRVFIPIFRYVKKLLKSINIFQLRSQMYCHVFYASPCTFCDDRITPQHTLLLLTTAANLQRMFNHRMKTAY